MGQTFFRATELSSWRRISLHLWPHPKDPSVYGNLEVNLRSARQYLTAINQRNPPAKVTLTHLVAKAIARALAVHPEANAIISRRRIFYRRSIDVFCQVATDGGRDLSGVKIAQADQKPLLQLATELADRVARIQQHTDSGSERTKRTVSMVPQSILHSVLKTIEFFSYDLRWDLSRFGVDYDQFGSAMVSNVGAFGVRHGLAPLVPATRTPIVLLVGCVEDRPVVEDGKLAIAPCVTIGCTFDHRLIDGYQAGAMASIVQETLEDPMRFIGHASRPSSTDDRILLDPHDTTNTDPDGSAYTDHSTESPPGTAPRESRSGG